MHKVLQGHTEFGSFSYLEMVQIGLTFTLLVAAMYAAMECGASKGNISLHCKYWEQLLC